MLGTIPFLEGLIVVFLMIFLQYIFAFLARTSSRMERIINTVPRPVFADNEFLEKTMAREAITKEEIYAAIRSAGIDQIKDVKAVVMELNGTMSVIKRTQGSGPSSLDDLNMKN